MKKRTLILTLIVVIMIGLILPQSFVIPVEKANKSSYHAKSFWFYPWGKSGTHKGVDIFAKEGTDVKSSTHGLVLYTGEIALGGNVILILGPKWRIHYYAHLKYIRTTPLSFAEKNEVIGTVGSTGNAKGKSPHLHYAITTLIPYPWRYDNDRQGWKKMFYLNPIEYM